MLKRIACLKARDGYILPGQPGVEGFKQPAKQDRSCKSQEKEKQPARSSVGSEKYIKKISPIKPYNKNEAGK
jgi:hypothetical protein